MVLRWLELVILWNVEDFDSLELEIPCAVAHTYTATKLDKISILSKQKSAGWQEPDVYLSWETQPE